MPTECYEVTFEHRTRPMCRRGRWVTETIAFAARGLGEVYLLAKAEGYRRYPRRRWKVADVRKIETGVSA